MLADLLGALAWLHGFSDPLAWVVVGAFLAGTLLELDGRPTTRYVLAAAWVVFAVFWLSLIYHFGPQQRSYVEGVGSAVAVPASLYLAALAWRGRESVFVLSRGIAAMGLIYMPFATIPWLRESLVRVVVDQTELLIALLGQDPTVVSGATVSGADYPAYPNTFYFEQGGHVITYTIVLACTGIGSMAIVAGVVAAVRAPLRRKLRALAISIPVIYALNLARNVFIALAFGQQRMHFFPDRVLWLFGASDPYMVSYFWADRIIAQSLSVVALVAITWLVVGQLPELLVVVEDLLAATTGRDVDLGGREVLADGESAT